MTTPDGAAVLVNYNAARKRRARASVDRRRVQGAGEGVVVDNASSMARGDGGECARTCGCGQRGTSASTGV